MLRPQCDTCQRNFAGYPPFFSSMPSTPFKNIIFDLGNVLNHCDLEYGVGKVARNCVSDAEAIHSWLAHSDVIDRFDGGKLTDQGFHEELAREFGWSGTLEELSQIWQDMLRPNDEMIALMSELQEQGFRVYVLSNINPMHAQLIHGPLDFIKRADGYVFSCECGMIKPEAEIFHHLLHKFKIKAEETIFIDDRPQNVSAASALGIVSILHASYEETREQLLVMLRRNH